MVAYYTANVSIVKTQFFAKIEAIGVISAMMVHHLPSYMILKTKFFKSEDLKEENDTCFCPFKLNLFIGI